MEEENNEDNQEKEEEEKGDKCNIKKKIEAISRPREEVTREKEKQNYL